MSRRHPTYFEIMCVFLAHISAKLNFYRNSNVGQVHTRLFLCDPERCVLFLGCQADVCVCVFVCVCGEWRMEVGRGSVSCSLQSTGKERLLSRGSASWVCCWPDQLAVCLAGVWHITTKGFGQTGDCTALINPLNLSRSTSFFPPLSLFLSSGMQRANMGSCGPWGKSNTLLIWSAFDRVTVHLPDWSWKLFACQCTLGSSCDVRITCCCFACSWRQSWL